jgi:L-ascorbate metabolism protein UlaG (beta-lactamase superfamily)
MPMRNFLRLSVYGLFLLMLCQVTLYKVVNGAVRGSLEVYYIANEGYLIAGGGKKVLIDALFREGIRPYLVSSITNRERLEQAQTPYDNVDLVLATHYHADHFDPLAVAAHIENNPKAIFISTEQSLEKIRASYQKINSLKERLNAAQPKKGERISFKHNGISLTVLNIHHGRNRPIENLGFLSEVAGLKFLHIGDSEATDNDFKLYQLEKEQIDIAFLPFWYFLDEQGKKAVRETIQPKHIVLMHIPSMIEEDDYIKRRGGWAKVLTDIKTEFPQAVYFEKELEKKVFN